MGRSRVQSVKRAAPESAKLAAELLSAGEVVSLPTETVYGLGASVTLPAAIERIFSLKQRPFSDPLIVHIGSFDWVFRYAQLSEKAGVVVSALAEAFWPGPLTLVLPSHDSVSRVVRAGGSTVALRCPKAPFFLDVLNRLGHGIAAPSANKFGHISPTSAQHVVEEFADEAFHIFDAGACSVGIESTVASVLEDGSVDILRPGGVSRRALEQTFLPLGVKLVEKARTSFSKRGARQIQGEEEIAQSPGQGIRHYAPDVQAFLIKNELPRVRTQAVSIPETVLIDYASELKGHAQNFLRHIDLAPDGCLETYARTIFAALREAEKVPGVRNILINFRSDPLEAMGEDNLHEGIVDRLKRATSGQTASFDHETGTAYFTDTVPTFASIP